MQYDLSDAPTHFEFRSFSNIIKILDKLETEASEPTKQQPRRKSRGSRSPVADISNKLADQPSELSKPKLSRKAGTKQNVLPLQGTPASTPHPDPEEGSIAQEHPQSANPRQAPPHATRPAHPKSVSQRMLTRRDWRPSKEEQSSTQNVLPPRSTVQDVLGVKTQGHSKVFDEVSQKTPLCPASDIAEGDPKRPRRKRSATPEPKMQRVLVPVDVELGPTCILRLVSATGTGCANVLQQLQSKPLSHRPGAPVWSTSLKREKVANCVVELSPKVAHALGHTSSNLEGQLYFVSDNVVSTIDSCVIGTSLHPENNFRVVCDVPCQPEANRDASDPLHRGKITFRASQLAKYVSISFGAPYSQAQHNTRIVYLTLSINIPTVEKVKDCTSDSPEGLVPMEFPMCRACGKLIQGDITNAIKHTWHPQCFTCTSCHEEIKSGQFTIRNGKPIHVACVRKDVQKSKRHIRQHEAREGTLRSPKLNEIRQEQHCSHNELGQHDSSSHGYPMPLATSFGTPSSPAPCYNPSPPRPSAFSPLVNLMGQNTNESSIPSFDLEDADRHKLLTLVKSSLQSTGCDELLKIKSHLLQRMAVEPINPEGEKEKESKRGISDDLLCIEDLGNNLDIGLRSGFDNEDFVSDNQVESAVDEGTGGADDAGIATDFSRSKRMDPQVQGMGPEMKYMDPEGVLKEVSEEVSNGKSTVNQPSYRPWDGQHQRNGSMQQVTSLSSDGTPQHWMDQQGAMEDAMLARYSAGSSPTIGQECEVPPLDLQRPLSPQASPSVKLTFSPSLEHPRFHGVPTTKVQSSTPPGGLTRAHGPIRQETPSPIEVKIRGINWTPEEPSPGPDYECRSNFSPAPKLQGAGVPLEPAQQMRPMRKQAKPRKPQGQLDEGSPMRRASDAQSTANSGVEVQGGREGPCGEHSVEWQQKHQQLQREQLQHQQAMEDQHKSQYQQSPRRSPEMHRIKQSNARDEALDVVGGGTVLPRRWSELLPHTLEESNQMTPCQNRGSYEARGNGDNHDLEDHEIRSLLTQPRRMSTPLNGHDDISTGREGGSTKYGHQPMQGNDVDQDGMNLESRSNRLRPAQSERGTGNQTSRTSPFQCIDSYGGSGPTGRWSPISQCSNKTTGSSLLDYLSPQPDHVVESLNKAMRKSKEQLAGGPDGDDQPSVSTQATTAYPQHIAELSPVKETLDLRPRSGIPTNTSTFSLGNYLQGPVSHGTNEESHRLELISPHKTSEHTESAFYEATVPSGLRAWIPHSSMRRNEEGVESHEMAAEIHPNFVEELHHHGLIWSRLRPLLGDTMHGQKRVALYPNCNMLSLKRILGMAQYSIFVITDMKALATHGHSLSLDRRRQLCVQLLQDSLSPHGIKCDQQVSSATASLCSITLPLASQPRTPASQGSLGQKWILLCYEDPKAVLQRLVQECVSWFHIDAFLDFECSLYSKLIESIMPLVTSDMGLAYYSDHLQGHPLLPFFGEPYQQNPLSTFTVGELRFTGRLESQGFLKLHIKRHSPVKHVWIRDPEYVQEYHFSTTIKVSLLCMNLADFLLGNGCPFDALLISKRCNWLLQRLLPHALYDSMQCKVHIAGNDFFTPSDGRENSSSSALFLLNWAEGVRASKIATLFFSKAEHNTMMDEIFCWPAQFPSAIHIFYMDPDDYVDIIPWFTEEELEEV